MIWRGDRSQSTLFPKCLEDWICEDYPVRVIDVFVDELDLSKLGFGGVEPQATGRPGDAVENLRLRIPQSCLIEPAP